MSSSLQNASIPVVDFAPLLGGRPDDAAVVGRAVYEAFRDIGFVYLKNHGFPQDTIDEAFEWVTDSFYLSRDKLA